MKKQRKQTEEQQPVNTRRKQLEKRKRELLQLIAKCTLDEYQRLAAEYSDVVYALECEIEIEKKSWRASARGSERRIPKTDRPFTLNK